MGGPLRVDSPGRAPFVMEGLQPVPDGMVPMGQRWLAHLGRDPGVELGEGATALVEVGRQVSAVKNHRVLAAPALVRRRPDGVIAGDRGGIQPAQLELVGSDVSVCAHAKELFMARNSPRQAGQCTNR